MCTIAVHDAADEKYAFVNYFSHQDAHTAVYKMNGCMHTPGKASFSEATNCILHSTAPIHCQSTEPFKGNHGKYFGKGV